MAEDQEGPDDSSGPRIDSIRDRLRASLEGAVLRFPTERKRAADAANPGGIGRLIGDATHHAGSIAFVAVIGLLVILGGTIIGIFRIDSNSVDGLMNDMKNVVQSLIALIGTILGYIFGRGASGKQE